MARGDRCDEPEQPKTVTVRIAVAVDRHGFYFAIGSTHYDDETMIREAEGGVRDTDLEVSFVTATLPIPSKPGPAEVEGTVEMRLDRAAAASAAQPEERKPQC